jgi:hypothetical protein
LIEEKHLPCQIRIFGSDETERAGSRPFRPKRFAARRQKADDGGTRENGNACGRLGKQRECAHDLCVRRAIVPIPVQIARQTDPFRTRRMLK